MSVNMMWILYSVQPAITVFGYSSELQENEVSTYYLWKLGTAIADNKMREGGVPEKNL
jgi:hypothetical protein